MQATHNTTGMALVPYWLMFALWAIGTVQTESRRGQLPKTVFFVAAALITTLLIGLRFEVGGDWGSYVRMYESIYFLSLPQAMSFTDPAYGATNWLASRGDLGMAFVNTVCAILFMGGLARLAWRQPNPALAVLVAIPYLIIVVAMGYTRQAAAIGIICFALADASERRLLRLVVLIGIAALFHKTAILILPVALVPIFRRNILLGMLGVAVFSIVAFFLLRDSADTLVTSYVQGNYDSQGAAIRVAMNVIAAVLFLMLRKRMDMPFFQKSFWVTCSLISILSVFALALASASSGIDRISLYLIPLQVICYSRLPYVLGTGDKALPSVFIGVLIYSFSVEFVWLNYADNAQLWLPFSLSL